MRSRVAVGLVAGFVVCAGACRGQAVGAAVPAVAKPAVAGATKPGFEVASVKAAQMDTLRVEFQAGRMPRIGAQVGHGRAEYDYMSLRQLLGVAYGLKPYQISGPEWLNTEHFVITAKMPDGAPNEQAPAMLQTLLEERFKLVAHRSKEERPVRALVVSKGGAKLKEATLPAAPLDEDAALKPGEMKINMGNGPAVLTRTAGGTVINMGEKGTFTQTVDAQSQMLHMKGENLTMDGFAEMLTQMSQTGPAGAAGGAAPVVNMTGLPGHYQVAVDLSLADLIAAARAQGMGGPPPPGGAGVGEASDPGSGGATLQAAVEALGLKLEARRAPVEQLVVDHMEKTPTED